MHGGTQGRATSDSTPPSLARAHSTTLQQRTGQHSAPAAAQAERNEGDEVWKNERRSRSHGSGTATLRWIRANPGLTLVETGWMQASQPRSCRDGGLQAECKFTSYAATLISHSINDVRKSLPAFTLANQCSFGHTTSRTTFPRRAPEDTAYSVCRSLQASAPAPFGVR